MRPRSRLSATLAALAVLAALGLAAAAQQPPAIKRTILSKTDVAGFADREAVMALVDLPPGLAEGKHTHPAEVFAFVLEGTASLDVEGAPKAIFKAGETFHILPGKVHEAANPGTTPAKLAVVFVAEKGKPLTTPVK